MYPNLFLAVAWSTEELAKQAKLVKVLLVIPS